MVKFAVVYTTIPIIVTLILVYWNCDCVTEIIVSNTGEVKIEVRVMYVEHHEAKNNNSKNNHYSTKHIIINMEIFNC